MAASVKALLPERKQCPEAEEPPDNIGDPEQYEPAPRRRDLNLGRRVALAFVQEELPEELPTAREIFSRGGAYGRFKQLLHANGALETWYAFEQRMVEDALRDWSEDVGVALI